MSALTDSDRALAAFLSTLIAIGFLSKVGGTGADLAIMTGLIGIAGMLAQSLKTSPKGQLGQPDGTKDDPFAVEGAGDKKAPVQTEEAKP